MINHIFLRKFEQSRATEDYTVSQYVEINQERYLFFRKENRAPFATPRSLWRWSNNSGRSLVFAISSLRRAGTRAILFSVGFRA